jgi:PAS domain S-box-containing protein
MKNVGANHPTAVLVCRDTTRLETLSGLVRKAGLESLAFTSVEAALAAMDPSAPPALIVTDLFMKGINGWRFCRLLRSREYAPFNQVPMIIASAAFSGDESEQIAVNLGAEALFLSPIEENAIIDRVKAILNGEHKRISLRALIVENNRTEANRLTKKFIGIGYQAVAAFSVRDAAEAFAKTNYNVAVIDNCLPDSPGDSLLDRFISAQPNCTCFMTATDPQPELILDWMKRGAAACLAKPFEPEYLLDLCARTRRERAVLRAEEMLEARTRQLRESEERYKRIAEAVSDYIYTVQIENGASAGTKHGPGCRTVTGYHEYEFDQNPFLWLNMVPFADREKVIEQARRAAAGESVSRIEHQIVRKDGEIRWVSNTPVLHRNECGILLCYEGIIRDITERKQAEVQLQQSHRRYQQLIEHANDGIFAINSNGFFSFVNESLCNMLGYTHEELLRLSILDTYPDEFQSEGRQRMAQVRRGESIQLERPMKRKDGSLIIIEASGWKSEEGNIHGIVRDVTERKQAEAQLQQSHQRYQQLVEHASDAIFTVNSEGYFSFMNEGLCNMLGYSHEELSRLHIIDTYTDEMRDEGRQRLARIKCGESIQFERLAKRKDGTLITIEACCWKSEEGHFQAIVRDITERKKAEDVREKLQEQLIQAQKMESVGRLAGGVAHDFNNILAAMMMNIGLAETFPNLDLRIKQTLKEIQSDAIRAANLTRQLLMFSRRSVLNMKLLDLNDVTAGMLTMLGRLLGENISLRFERNNSLPTIHADAGMIEQVLMNLAVNARDAMPKGGLITIRIDDVDIGQEQIKSIPEVKPGRFVCLSVSDTGCGMDENTRAHIFEPFFTTKESGKGTGLGLSTVYGIAAQHHGWVEVASEIGNGTIFRVFLPSAQASIPETSQSREEAVIGGHETILLVEDDRSLMLIMAQGLRSLGYRVINARNGQDAIQKWKQHHQQIDMLFSDMVMPEGLTGLDLAERFRASKPDLRIIISSGYSAEMVGEEKISLENIVYLPKPYRIEAMAKAIRDSFGQ